MTNWSRVSWLTWYNYKLELCHVLAECDTYILTKYVNLWILFPYTFFTHKEYHIKYCFMFVVNSISLECKLSKNCYWMTRKFVFKWVSMVTNTKVTIPKRKSDLKDNTLIRYHLSALTGQSIVEKMNCLT